MIHDKESRVKIIHDKDNCYMTKTKTTLEASYIFSASDIDGRRHQRTSHSKRSCGGHTHFDDVLLGVAPDARVNNIVGVNMPDRARPLIAEAGVPLHTSISKEAHRDRTILQSPEGIDAPNHALLCANEIVLVEGGHMAHRGGRCAKSIVALKNLGAHKKLATEQINTLGHVLALFVQAIQQDCVLKISPCLYCKSLPFFVLAFCHKARQKPANTTHGRHHVVGVV